MGNRVPGTLRGRRELPSSSVPFTHISFPDRLIHNTRGSPEYHKSPKRKSATLEDTVTSDPRNKTDLPLFPLSNPSKTFHEPGSILALWEQISILP